MFEKSGLPEGTRGAAVCLWKLGRKSEALEKLRATAERMPDDDQVLWELFRSLNFQQTCAVMAIIVLVVTLFDLLSQRLRKMVL